MVRHSTRSGMACPSPASCLLQYFTSYALHWRCAITRLTFYGLLWLDMRYAGYAMPISVSYRLLTFEQYISLLSSTFIPRR